MVNKIFGYAIAALGLAGLAFTSFSDISKLSFIPSFMQAKHIMIASLILIILGVIFVFQNKKNKQPREVPIYEGHGKKRTIVGYQRMEKG